MKQRTPLADRIVKVAPKPAHMPYPVPADGDPELANVLWLAAVRAEAAKRGISLTGSVPRQVVGRRPVLRGAFEAAEMPSPTGCSTAADFLMTMRRLRRWAGQPTLRELEARAAAAGRPVSKSTLSRVLSEHNSELPTDEVMTAFVLACGLDERKWRDWSRALQRVHESSDYMNTLLLSGPLVTYNDGMICTYAEPEATDLSGASPTFVTPTRRPATAELHRWRRYHRPRSSDPEDVADSVKSVFRAASKG